MANRLLVTKIRILMAFFGYLNLLIPVLLATAVPKPPDRDFRLSHQTSSGS